MCTLCAEWAKGNMTKGEVIRAIGELEDNDPDHIYYLMREITESEEES